MEKKKPLILISNDDGYHSKGLRCLIDMVREFGELLVCAPESARSGYSCAFSAAEPLRLKLRRKTEGVAIWSCSGTPVDCVKMALELLCPDRRPDLVIGGINHGDNASVNAHYSGTMGVTFEGCMKYIPSVAFSLCDHSDDADFEPLTPLVKRITRRLLDEGLPLGVCLNVNFPLRKSFEGVRVCRMAKGTWGKEVVCCRHPRGYDYYWMTGEYTNDEPDADDTDNWALRHGYVAITPTQIDVTCYEIMDKMKQTYETELS
ncbi:MAG: 5'/3'-nucleotidase SurE [Prevotella sp.]